MLFIVVIASVWKHIFIEELLLLNEEFGMHRGLFEDKKVHIHVGREVSSYTGCVQKIHVGLNSQTILLFIFTYIFNTVFWFEKYLLHWISVIDQYLIFIILYEAFCFAH